MVAARVSEFHDSVPKRTYVLESPAAGSKMTFGAPDGMLVDEESDWLVPGGTAIAGISEPRMPSHSESAHARLLSHE
jgi:hypothetical protein